MHAVWLDIQSPLVFPEILVIWSIFSPFHFAKLQTRVLYFDIVLEVQERDLFLRIRDFFFKKKNICQRLVESSADLRKLDENSLLRDSWKAYDQAFREFYTRINFINTPCC
jgi:hypothetical protein